MFKNKEYILAICKEGSFTKAAEKLFVSQPSLSASVRRIESRVGAPIFDRSTTPVSLTEIGREYVEYALAIEEKEGNFVRYVADHANLMAGTIRIGGSSFFSSFVLPKMISEFNRQHEKIVFEIFEGSTKHLMERLSTGDLDLVIDNALIADENIISSPYITERLLLAVPKEFSINTRLAAYRMTAQDIKKGLHLTHSGVSLPDFREEAFILLQHENDTGNRAEKLLKKHGIAPKILFRLDQQITAYNISCSGIGISFVSDTLVKSMPASADVFYYNPADDLAVRNIYFYTKKNHYHSLACRKFIEHNTVATTIFNFPKEI